MCADPNLAFSPSKPEHGRPRGWFFWWFWSLPAMAGRSGRFSVAFVVLCQVPASESGKEEDAIGRQQYPASLPARPLAKFSLLSNIHHENMCPSGSPQEGCELLHPCCLERNLALLSSKISVPFNHGSCTKGLFCWQTCCYFTCCFYVSCWGLRVSNVSSIPSLRTHLQYVEGYNLIHSPSPFLSKAALSARFSSVVSCSVSTISMCWACQTRHTHSSTLNSPFAVRGIPNPEGLNQFSKNESLWIPVCRTRKPFQGFCASCNKDLICITYSPNERQ